MKTTADKLAELRHKLDLADNAGSAKAIAKRKSLGLPTPRERIDMILDRGSFVEYGALVKAVGGPDHTYGDGVVTGRGTVEGRPVVVYSHDQTVFGGSLGEMFGRKVCAIMELAVKIGCPLIGINDSGGARVQESVNSLAFYAEIGKRQAMISGLAPQISIMLGKCAGGAAYSPACTDFVVAVEDQAYMFVTGPEILESVTGEKISIDDLGGARAQASYGTVHHVAKTESDAFEWVRTLLGYLPTNCHEETPLVNPGIEPAVTDSDRGLNTFLPDSDNAAYDMHDVLIRLFDDGEFHEVSSEYAPNVITGFSRVDGRTVGVMANQPLYLSGALDIKSSEKAARFLLICDAYNIPIISVVDIPGYLPGLEQESGGVIYRGAKLLAAIIEATVPKVTVVIRKAYGGGYAVMGSKNLGADINFAWPTARIAVMGAEGAVALLKKREIEAAGDRGHEVRQGFIDFYNEFIATPYMAAERGFIDAVIQPEDTRLELRRALQLLRDKEPQYVPPRRRSLLRPV